LEAHIVFICYKKGFDSIQRQVLFDILKSINIPDITKGNTGHIHTKQNINQI